MLKGKTILVTGGTGSFGNTIVRRFLEDNVGEVRVFSRDESKQEAMRLSIRDDRAKFYIGDVRELDSLRYEMKGVDYVFHAAALKQVPSCEFFPMEAYKTNVLGTENVIRSAERSSVTGMVLLSTDKAVYPVNAMGISKAMAEKVMLANAKLFGKDGTLLCATRYGNVMASRGSVIPLFLNQISQNKDLTLTSDKMTRFMMTLEESVDLVLHAFNVGQQGDIFVKKSPSTTIHAVAEELIEIMKSSSKIKIIGMRHGEKLYESLVSSEEMVRSMLEKEFYRITADNRDINYEKYFVEGEPKILENTDYNSDTAPLLSRTRLREMLLTLPIVQKQKRLGLK